MATPYYDTTILSAEQRTRAWELNYRTGADDLPDGELQWERDVWTALGVDAVAEIADALLAERRAAEQFMPGGAEPADLNVLFSRVNVLAALRIARDEAQPLVCAMRLCFWNSLAETRR